MSHVGHSYVGQWILLANLDMSAFFAAASDPYFVHLKNVFCVYMMIICYPNTTA